ncbi:MAG: putative bifunctional diguanylate cyclase/phosphodiesterase [Acidimicrobiales bacterium]
MNHARIPTSPVLAAVAGLIASAAATVLVFSGVATTQPEDLYRTAVVAGAGVGVAGLVAAWQRGHSIDTSKRLSEAHHDANHDPLTGLVNRLELYRQLEETLDQARRERTVFGVLFLDLDRFKVINDSLGHDVGDDLLKIVAERLRSATRSGDVVARLGGDEFVIICRGLMTERSVVAVAEQILRRFTEPVSLKGRQQQISTSVGVAIASSDETRDPEELVRDADAAMYVAKRNRSGFAVFDEAQRSMLVDRLAIERDLRRALDTDGQLVVFYQPIMDAASDSLYALEALIRWDHPERGLIPPEQFLSVAADARLMAQIGELVLREACAQAALWNHRAPEMRSVRIGVNVDEQQLVDAGLPNLVAEVLHWSGLEPAQLVLEITEDLIVDHLDGLDMLHQIRALGVSLAIDDFGTGQSSLAYAKQFENIVSTLKIDKSFVADMVGGRADLAIVEAVVAMAGHLDLKVVAEGVENREQLEILTRLGVRYMQGYYFDPPRSAEDLGDPRRWVDHVGLAKQHGPRAGGRRGGPPPVPAALAPRPPVPAHSLHPT